MLIEAAEEFDGVVTGSCIIVDADVDVLTIIDWARDYGVDEIFLVFPPCGRAEGKGVVFLGSYKPVDAVGIDPGDLVRDIWMNLTGSLSLEDVVSAMRLLSPFPFKVFSCVPSRDGCRTVLEDWFKATCNAGS
ncbi:MAG: hypothetical protein DSY37_04750 [Hyperthermus sp.]|nr:MAG: hypothetical protein DSY37_04750 [Hyperthermus sp.]